MSGDEYFLIDRSGTELVLVPVAADRVERRADGSYLIRPDEATHESWTDD